MGWRAQRRRSVLVFSVVAGGLGLSQQSVAEPARSLAQAPHEAGSEVDRPSDAETEQAAARKGLAELRMRAQRIAEEAGLARGDAALEAARRCGKAWTDVARASEPANLDGAEALLSAAECFERAHAINAAIAARRALLRDFPGSPSVGSSVKWLVRAERTFGRFADAAALAEDFARRFARDPATKELLREATTLRIALRDADAARRDVDLITEYYDGDDLEFVASMVWALRDLEEDDAGRARHAEEYLQRHRDAGGVDRRVVAEVQIAAEMWRRACVGGETLGLCLKPQPQPKSKAGERPTRCGPAPTLQPKRRSKRLAREAKRRFEELRRFLATSSPRATERIREAIPEEDLRRRWEFEDAIAEAALLLSDGELEVYLALEFPDRAHANLYIDPDLCASRPLACERERHRRHLADRELFRFFKELYSRAAELGKTYRSETFLWVYSLRWHLRAAYRQGQITRHIAEVMDGAPHSPRFGDKEREVYCEIVQEYGARFTEEAISALHYCVDRSIMTATWTDTSDACAAALRSLDPKASTAKLDEYTGRPTLADDEVLAPRSVGPQLETPRELLVPEASGEECGHQDRDCDQADRPS